MSTIAARLQSLSDDERRAYEDLVDRFEDDWASGVEPPPEPSSYLPEGLPLRPLVLVALVKSDLESRRRRGESIRLERYLQLFAELAEDPDAIVELETWDSTLEASNHSGRGNTLGPTDAAGSADGRSAPPSWEPPPGYSSLRFLGRGATGIVYQARDDALGRSVALKVFDSDQLHDARVQARFEREGRIIAGLGHPNIIGVYDVGQSGGRPFHVLEYCPGGNLLDLLRKGPLEPRTAARLMATLAFAVQEAHDRDVIHRDLKPANILFAAGGIPKIADFGLAKLRRDGEGADGHDLTSYEGFLGTPNYMAPEQVRGADRVLGAADVYSLGSMLYHCLAGSPPFAGLSRQDTLLRLLYSEPAWLSNSHRDLATICHKCLAKEPGRRYSSAGELGQDLERFLQGRPILARPTGPIERSWRWSKRNPALASLAALAAAALVLVVVMSIAYGIQQGRAASRLFEEQGRTEARRLEAEANLARARRAVDDSFTAISENRLLKAPGQQKLRKQLLEYALASYREFVQLSSGDPARRADLAAAHFRLGDVLDLMGSKGEALDQFGLAFQIRQALVEGRPDDRQSRRDVAACWSKIGMLLGQTGRSKEALETLLKARKTFEDLGRGTTVDPSLLAELAKVDFLISRQYGQSGQHAEALDALGRARVVQEDLVRQSPSNPGLRKDLAATLGATGYETDWTDSVAASGFYKRAIAVLEDLNRDQPGDFEYLNFLAKSTNNLGQVQMNVEGMGDPMVMLGRTLEIREELVRLNPDVAVTHLDLAGTLGNIAIQREKQGQVAESRATYRRAIDLLEDLVRKEPRSTDPRDLLARMLESYADRLGPTDSALALSSYRRSHDLFEALSREDVDNLETARNAARSKSHLGEQLLLDGQLDEALSLLQAARSVEEALVAKEGTNVYYRDDLGFTCRRLGVAFGRKAQASTALDYFREAIRHHRLILDQAPSQIGVRRALASDYLAMLRLLISLGRLDEVASAIVARRQVGADDPDATLDLAGELAQAVKSVENAKGEDRLRWADLATDSLRDAIRQGYKEARRLAEDSRFAVLRDRDDFRSLTGQTGPPG